MEVHFSPLDVRYKKDLPRTLAEEKRLEDQIKVEKKWLMALGQAGVIPKVDEQKMETALDGLSFDEIAAIEKTTQHATRALVEAMNVRFLNHGCEDLVPWTHVGLTSFDTVDTAQRVNFKEFFIEDALPLLDELKAELRRWAREHENSLQAGRTHGQWAVPTFFGLSFAEAHERLESLGARLTTDLDQLTGQASGAIGGYHASALLVKDPLKLEKDFLKSLNLVPHYGSIQTLPPEDIIALAATCFSIGSVVAKVANDLRHLARSEIFEVIEGLGEGQVGSSTMPQKRNPWNLEHVCSLFKILNSKFLLSYKLIASPSTKEILQIRRPVDFTENIFLYSF